MLCLVCCSKSHHVRQICRSWWQQHACLRLHTRWQRGILTPGCKMDHMPLLVLTYLNCPSALTCALASTSTLARLRAATSGRKLDICPWPPLCKDTAAVPTQAREVRVLNRTTPFFLLWELHKAADIGCSEADTRLLTETSWRSFLQQPVQDSLWRLLVTWAPSRAGPLQLHCSDAWFASVFGQVSWFRSPADP